MPSNMNLDTAGENAIKQYEACSLKIYKDQGGKPTIGWGHLIKKGEDFTNGISQEIADQMFTTDVQHFVSGVNSFLKVQLNQNQFNALVSLAFNIGLRDDKRKKGIYYSKVLELVNQGIMSGEELHQAWLKYHHVSVHQPDGSSILQDSSGLLKRREKEWKTFIS